MKADDPEGKLLEFPLSVYRVPFLGWHIPIAGGFYLRSLPYEFIGYAIRRINKAGQPAVCYLHPWDLDPCKPVIEELRWYHYYRLHVAEEKFHKMLHDFRFVSTMEFIENEHRG